MKGLNSIAAGSSSRLSWYRSAAISAAFTMFAMQTQGNEPPLPATEHGLAKLTITVQGQRLAIAFDSPAANLLGFDHAPQSDTEQRAASYARGQLQQAPRLFITSPGANCRLFASKVDEPAWDGEAEHHDYRARYVFQCQRPQRLQAIDVQLINQLERGTKLQTKVVVGGTRQSLELTAEQSTVRIAQ